MTVRCLLAIVVLSFAVLACQSIDPLSVGREEWPLSLQGQNLLKSRPNSSLLTFKAVLRGAATISVSHHGSIFLHADLQPAEHAVVFRHHFDGEWGPENRRHVSFAGAVELNVTLSGHSAVQIDLAGDGQRHVVSFELPVDGGAQFSFADTVELACNCSPCLLLDRLTVANHHVAVHHFPVAPADSGHSKRAANSSVDGLLVAVMSAPNYFSRRMAVRSTWTQMLADYPAQLRFFLGDTDDEDVRRSVAFEQALFGDMVLLPYTDRYSELTRKTQAMVRYAVSRPDVSYLLKCDDDTLIFVDRFIDSLAQHTDQRYLYFGYISNDVEPLRDPNHPCYVSVDDYPAAHFPPYANGPGYVLSRPLLEKVVESWDDSAHSRHLVNLTVEDVSVGQWVQHLQQEHGLDVAVRADYLIIPVGCQDDAILIHYVTPERMRCVWERYLSNSTDLCCLS